MVKCRAFFLGELTRTEFRNPFFMAVPSLSILLSKYWVLFCFVFAFYQKNKRPCKRLLPVKDVCLDVGKWKSCYREEVWGGGRNKECVILHPTPDYLTMVKQSTTVGFAQLDLKDN